MSEKITTRQLSERRKGKTDWKRVDALSDGQIAKAIRDDPDTSEASRSWFENAMVLKPARRS